MANRIPGISGRIQPGAVVNVRRSQSVTGAGVGARSMLIIGEGVTEETVVRSAKGGGNDGLNPDYSGSDTPDGRHFQLSFGTLVTNRTKLYKNGVELAVLESDIDNQAFASRYDARVEISSGRIELQRSRLRSFGGQDGYASKFFKIPDGTTNTGNGTITIDQNSLLDINALPGTYTATVAEVQVDAAGDRVSGSAKIRIKGPDGIPLKDANGNVIIWLSDGASVTNDTFDISFADGSTVFARGDSFQFVVDSGILRKNDKLTAEYIAEENLNTVFSYDSISVLQQRHGTQSASNTLSLGANLAFANGAARVLAVQAKPSRPRKTSAVLMEANNPFTTTTEGASGGTALNDCIFPLPRDVTVDSNSSINVFITSSDGTEEQVLLNKYDFYDNSFSTTALAYSGFSSSSSHNSEYTVISAPEVEQSGEDGYIFSQSTTKIKFTSPTAVFTASDLDTTESDLDKQLVIIGGSFAGTYNITKIGNDDGDNTTVFATKTSGTITHPSASSDALEQWQLIDPSDNGSWFCLADDVVSAYLTEGKGLRISYVDDRDADFYDASWTEAFAAAEEVDTQFIVPLPREDISGIFQAAKIHVESMSAPQFAFERRALVGTIDGLTAENLTGETQAAVEDIGVLEGLQGDSADEVLAGSIEDLTNYSVYDAFGDSARVLYCAPGSAINVVLSGTTTRVNGFFAAAGVAGRIVSLNPFQDILTYKTVTGFEIPVTEKYTKDQKNALAAAGVMVIDRIAGGGKILHGITTASTGNAGDEEFSVGTIRDEVARLLRAVTSQFIGKAFDNTLLITIASAITTSLNGLVGSALQSFTQPIISVDPLEPRQLNVSLSIKPVLPINWISVDVSENV